MKKQLYLLLGVLFILLLLSASSERISFSFVNEKIKQFASVFFVDSTTKVELKDKYSYANLNKFEDRVKILIVPGHDKKVFGTGFRGVKEFDVNIELTKYLADFLKTNKSFDVVLAQDRNGYNEALVAYFENERENIKKFRDEQKVETTRMVLEGLIDFKRGLEHNRAPSEAALKLYGINKWSNENDIDIVIHAHFNDEPTRSWNNAGKYSGFAIYIPEQQFSNAKASKALAEHVFEALASRLSPSDMPLENDGLVEDQELIAIGAYNSLDAAVLFIEYSYIYEPQIYKENVRPMALKEAAFQTYSGIQNFFGNPISAMEEKAIFFPYVWNNNFGKNSKNNKDVFFLQTALLHEGLYPPHGSTKSDCPLSGNFFNCTKRAVTAFQKKYDIEQTGFIGPITRGQLNANFGNLNLKN